MRKKSSFFERKKSIVVENKREKTLKQLTEALLRRFIEVGKGAPRVEIKVEALGGREGLLEEV